MKFITLSFILILISSNIFSQTPDTKETACKRKYEEAILDAEGGKLTYTINFGFGGELPRYENELEDILQPHNVKFKIVTTSHVLPSCQQCYKNYMDSIISVKYGVAFIKNINEQADSLFYERNKNLTFDSWDIDKWAIHPSNEQQLGGDYIIQRLNIELGLNEEYRFVSNVVNRPHFIIEFIIDRTGKITECAIIKRELEGLQNIDALQLESFITKSVNKIDDWIPAKIRGNNVSAKFQRGVAVQVK